MGRLPGLLKIDVELFSVCWESLFMPHTLGKVRNTGAYTQRNHIRRGLAQRQVVTASYKKETKCWIVWSVGKVNKFYHHLQSVQKNQCNAQYLENPVPFWQCQLMSSTEPQSEQWGGVGWFGSPVEPVQCTLPSKPSAFCLEHNKGLLLYTFRVQSDRLFAPGCLL